MHQTKQYLPRIVVTYKKCDYEYSYIRGEHFPINCIYQYWHYDNIHDLIHYNGVNFINYHSGYSIIDQFGDDITIDDIPPQYFKKRKIRNRKFSGRKRNRRSSFRHPKTFSEAKASFDSDIQDYNIKVRNSRSAKHLPNVYCELWRHNNKNWKKYRKNQYKVK